VYVLPASCFSKSFNQTIKGGFIHTLIEGYYSLTFLTIHQRHDLLAQMWKVYSLSDSRYLTQNAFVLCMKSITAIFWGPLSFLVASLIVKGHPLRYPLQTVLSLGQLYGEVLYYATNVFDEFVYGVSYSRPEAEVFWGLYVFLNAFWIVIPLSKCLGESKNRVLGLIALVLLCTSVKASGRAFAALAKMEMVLKRNGAAKKSLILA